MIANGPSLTTKADILLKTCPIREKRCLKKELASNGRRIPHAAAKPSRQPTRSRQRSAPRQRTEPASYGVGGSALVGTIVASSAPPASPSRHPLSPPPRAYSFAVGDEPSQCLLNSSAEASRIKRRECDLNMELSQDFKYRDFNAEAIKRVEMRANPGLRLVHYKKQNVV